MEILIDETTTAKRKVHICRVNADGTLTTIKVTAMNVTTNFATMEETAIFQKRSYRVQGTIYMSYIVVEV